MTGRNLVRGKKRDRPRRKQTWQVKHIGETEVEVENESWETKTDRRDGEVSSDKFEKL